MVCHYCWPFFFVPGSFVVQCWQSVKMYFWPSNEDSCPAVHHACCWPCTRVLLLRLMHLSVLFRNSLVKDWGMEESWHSTLMGSEQGAHCGSWPWEDEVLGKHVISELFRLHISVIADNIAQPKWWIYCGESARLSFFLFFFLNLVRSLRFISVLLISHWVLCTWRIKAVERALETEAGHRKQVWFVPVPQKLDLKTNTCV